MQVRWKRQVPRFLLALLALCLLELAGALFPGSWLDTRPVRMAWLGIAALTVAGLLVSPAVRAARRLQALHDVGRRMAQPTDLQAILDSGVTRAVLLTGAECGSVRLLEEGRLALAGSVRCHPRSPETHREVVPETPALRRAVESGEPTLVPPEAAGAVALGMVARGGPRSVALVPLVSAGRVCGLITLAYTHREPAEEDWELLKALRAMLGAAVANARVYEQLSRESRTDALTGLGSRRHFEDLFRRELARARREHRPLSLAMIDVDDMKEINDRWGHVTGDRVLEALGRLLGRVRTGDVVARYGGDEFVILMPNTSHADAEIAVRRIRDQLESFNADKPFPFPLRISIGIRQMTDPEADLVAEADAAMYTEKRRTEPEEAADSEELLAQ